MERIKEFFPFTEDRFVIRLPLFFYKKLFYVWYNVDKYVRTCYLPVKNHFVTEKSGRGEFLRSFWYKSPRAPRCPAKLFQHHHDIFAIGTTP